MHFLLDDLLVLIHLIIIHSSATNTTHFLNSRYYRCCPTPDSFIDDAISVWHGWLYL